MEGEAKARILPSLLLKRACDFFLRFYLFTHETQGERDAETQSEGEAGSTQGAQRWTQSRVSRIMPWAEGSAKLLSHPGCLTINLFLCLFIV